MTDEFYVTTERQRYRPRADAVARHYIQLRQESGGSFESWIHPTPSQGDPAIFDVVDFDTGDLRTIVDYTTPIGDVIAGNGILIPVAGLWDIHASKWMSATTGITTTPLRQYEFQLFIGKNAEVGLYPALPTFYEQRTGDPANPDGMSVYQIVQQVEVTKTIVCEVGDVLYQVAAGYAHEVPTASIEVFASQGLLRAEYKGLTP